MKQISEVEENPFTLYLNICPEAVISNFKEPRNRFQGIDSASLCSLVGLYDSPIPTQFLASIDCSKIPAQNPAIERGGGGRNNAYPHTSS